MKIRMAGPEVHLEGDWTCNGVGQKIDVLADSLQQLEFARVENLRVDCAKVYDADVTGLELLLLWLECARIRGVKPVLVNISERLQKIMLELNFRYCLNDEFLNTHMVC